MTNQRDRQICAQTDRHADRVPMEIFGTSRLPDFRIRVFWRCPACRHERYVDETPDDAAGQMGLGL